MENFFLPFFSSSFPSTALFECPYFHFILCLSFRCCCLPGCEEKKKTRSVWSIITKTIWFSCTQTQRSETMNAKAGFPVCLRPVFFSHYFQQKKRDGKSVPTTPSLAYILAEEGIKSSECYMASTIEGKTVVRSCRNTTQVQLYTIIFLLHILAGEEREWERVLIDRLCACAVFTVAKSEDEIFVVAAVTADVAAASLTHSAPEWRIKEWFWCGSKVLSSTKAYVKSLAYTRKGGRSSHKKEKRENELETWGKSSF